MTQPCARATAIPTRQILESRSTFPTSEIEFEVLISLEEPWRGFALCAEAFAAAGLTCRSVRYAEKGFAFFRLRDERASDLRALEERLAAAPAVSIVSWSTIIGVGGSAAA